MSTVPKQLVSPLEYLERERRSEDKHEYFAGEMFAMGGASRSHVRIVSNLVRALGQALLTTSCEVSSTDLRVGIPSTGLYTYPDVIVTCGPELFLDQEQDVLLNPLVLFEVLSPSTESYDRGHKFAGYRNIPSLREYCTVAQDKVHVEQWRRQDDGNWTPTFYKDLSAMLAIISIDVSIPISGVYRNAL